MENEIKRLKLHLRHLKLNQVSDARDDIRAVTNRGVSDRMVLREPRLRYRQSKPQLTNQKLRLHSIYVGSPEVRSATAPTSAFAGGSEAVLPIAPLQRGTTVQQRQQLNRIAGSDPFQNIFDLPIGPKTQRAISETAIRDFPGRKGPFVVTVPNTVPGGKDFERGTRQFLIWRDDWRLKGIPVEDVLSGISRKDDWWIFKDARSIQVAQRYPEDSDAVRNEMWRAGERDPGTRDVERRIDAGKELNRYIEYFLRNGDSLEVSKAMTRRLQEEVVQMLGMAYFNAFAAKAIIDGITPDLIEAGEGVGRGLRGPTGGRASEINAHLAETEAQITAERTRVSAQREATTTTRGSNAWANERAGASKGLYNLLEHRAVLNMQKNNPNRTYLEQVELVGIKTQDRIHSIEGKGRIADFAEHDGESVRLGDFKSQSEIKASVKGGLTRGGVEAEFRGRIKEQHANERSIIQQAKDLNGQVVIRGRDPMTLRPVQLTVDPNQIKPSRVTTYTDLPNN